jgi:hypothetical protein
MTSSEIVAIIEGYEFQCEAGPLTLCQDWIDLKEALDRLETEATQLRLAAAWANYD